MGGSWRETVTSGRRMGMIWRLPWRFSLSLALFLVSRSLFLFCSCSLSFFFLALSSSFLALFSPLSLLAVVGVHVCVRARGWVLCVRHTCLYAHRWAYVYMYAHTHTYMHTCKPAYIHACIHTYTRMYIHTYIHTYIRTLCRTLYTHSGGRRRDEKRSQNFICAGQGVGPC